MNTDKIIEMANQAELCQCIWINDDDVVIASLVAFAKLVAAKEREACAEVCWWLAAEFDSDSKTAIRCTDAIRARGKA